MTPRPRLLVLVLPLLAASCASRSTSPYGASDAAAPRARDTARAGILTREAAGIIDAQPQRAESLLRQALAADIFHAPAHNNLGVLLLARNDLYAAAEEFEWAKRLLPSHPDPRLNLAITLERAGRVDEAIESCRSALEVYPEHLPSVQALARMQVRHARTDDRTPRLLADIAFRADTEQWREWARLEAIRMQQ